MGMMTTMAPCLLLSTLLPLALPEALECPSSTVTEARVMELGDVATITSPNFPRRYPNNYNCRWAVSSVGCRLGLACGEVDTRAFPDCRGDYIRVRAESNNKIDRRFCRNSTVEMTFPNHVKQITLQFRTNKRHRSSGFNCTLSCDAETEDEENGFQVVTQMPQEIENSSHKHVDSEDEGTKVGDEENSFQIVTQLPQEIESSSHKHVDPVNL